MRSNKSYNNSFSVQFFCSKNVIALAARIEILLPSPSVAQPGPAWPGLISLRIYTDLSLLELELVDLSVALCGSVVAV